MVNDLEWDEVEVKSASNMMGSEKVDYDANQEDLNDVEAVVVYYDADGNEISEDEYNELQEED